MGASAFAANEAGWDVGRWGVHFTILFNEESEEYEDFSVWRDDGVEYYIMRFHTPEPAAAREAHMKSGYLYDEEIVAERPLVEKASSKRFTSGLETEYLYPDGEDTYALVFSCRADEWDENEFYREDLFTSVSKY